MVKCGLDFSAVPKKIRLWVWAVWAIAAALPAQASVANLKPRNAKELASMVAKMSPEDLKNLDPVELNFLKNAIFASHGYEFAADRWYLREYFYEDSLAVQENSWERAGVFGSQGASPTVEVIQDMRWKGALDSAEQTACTASPAIDLRDLAFPPPGTLKFSMTRDMERAISVVMSAIFRRSADLKRSKIDFRDHLYFDEHSPQHGLCLFGRTSRPVFWMADSAGTDGVSKVWFQTEPGQRLDAEVINDAIRSELMGYSRLLDVLSEVHHGNFRLEQSDFLGFYLGSVDLFHSFLRMMSGEKVSETLLPQLQTLRSLLKTSEPKFPLSTENKAHLKRLMDLATLVGRKIAESSNGDLPDELKNKKIELDGSLGFYEGC